MYKLLVSDMDGTLIGPDEVLHSEIIYWKNKLREKGILFTIATGRVETIVESYIHALAIDIPYIVSNGATIIEKGHVIHRRTIPLSGLKSIINLALTEELSIIYTIEGNEFPLKETDWIVKERNKFNRYKIVRPLDEVDWHYLHIDKLTIMDGNHSGKIEMIESLANQLSTEYTYTKYADRAIEIVESKSNKANALGTILKRLGLTMSEAVVIGDHQNDVEMLREAGLGIAVGNAVPDAIAAADYVTKADCYEGVIEVMKKLANT